MHALQGPLQATGFARLWTAAAVSNLGDGVTMVAGPLLLAAISDDPALIAGGAFAGQLPWLLFALVSGAFVDRLDRRRLIVTVNLLRGAVLAVLAVAVATGHVTVPLVYLVAFLLGVGETLADTAYGALLPSVVAPEDLDRANARLGATFTIANQFVAKPFGAWLYGIAAALPFGLDAASFVAAALLIAGLSRTAAPLPGSSSPPASEPAPARRRDLRAEIREGLRWLWNHRLLRTLALAMGVANIVFCAAFAVFVLYARDRLGLSEVGFGFLLTTFAVGGLTGAGLATRLSRRFGTGRVLRAGLIVELGTHLTLAITTNPVIAGAAIVIFGVHAMVWGVLVTTIRQRAVPDPLRGRVGSVYALLETGGAAVGWLLGAIMTQFWSVTTPFWFAASAMLAVTAAAWRPLSRINPVPGTPTA
ncbi:MFS family permease [Actinoplanes octamycinicus]|uniref:MFS family permease n=1 Tax=Actinoplanes octamycinicus TaxID=135948 RepID=A0A7W7H5Z3_9ACTN|nr:MFS transporter [Actinoplanes octamycinicus]MBB4744447.1 MFS family permease [Actinoplanes octamycinicus]GIE61636.1 MFS transporter [Actinoplanes octamycinicus]